MWVVHGRSRLPGLRSSNAARLRVVLLEPKLLPSTTREGGTAGGSSGGCVSKTCTALGYECGMVSDGCGTMLSCGDCAMRGGGVCMGGQCI
jgi:hypothetical protein